MFNKVWCKIKIVTSNSQERTKRDYQPGGMAKVVVDKSVSQVCNTRSDILGRWPYVIIKGRKKRK
eukprot:7592419-Ditylum_brightwellii.AAC.1